MQALLKMLGTVKYVVGHCDSDGPETHPSVALCAMNHLLFVLPLDGPPWRTVCSTSVWSYGAVRLLMQSRDPTQGPGSCI